MFIFTKMTQIPVKINNKNPRLASYILSQYGGPDGELGASLRYLSQRFAQTEKSGIALLTDIGTEELGHLEMIGSIVTQLTKGEGARSFDKYGVGSYYIDHANAVYPASAAGVPFTAAYLQSKADPIADIMEDMAADGATQYLPTSPQSRTTKRFDGSKFPINLQICGSAVRLFRQYHHFIDENIDNGGIKLGTVEILFCNLGLCFYVLFLTLQLFDFRLAARYSCFIPFQIIIV